MLGEEGEHLILRHQAMIRETEDFLPQALVQAQGVQLVFLIACFCWPQTPLGRSKHDHSLWAAGLLDMRVALAFLIWAGNTLVQLSQ